MTELLFEIGTEELPPGLICSLNEQLKINLINELKSKDITVLESSLKLFNTPRRIAIYISDLPLTREVKEIEIKGPDKSKAFDSNGNPTASGTGFAKKYNLEAKDLIIKKVNDSEYVFAVVKTGGEKTIELLKEILPDSIKQIKGEKFMKWANNDERFARPIKWILAILDTDIIDFKYASIKSGNFTYGHRFLSNKKIEIKHPAQYENILEENYIIPNQLKRKEKISSFLNSTAKQLKASPGSKYRSLVEDVTNITEFPAPLMCNFDKDFLKLPSRVIETVLFKHQKSFVFMQNDKILPDFLVITNGTELNNDSFKKKIKKGNEKVVQARLRDANFFYENDLKTPFTYKARIKKLSNVTFQKNLGSLEEKVTRIIKLSEYIYECISVKTTLDISLGDVIETAKLCKLDLTTNMVFEFTELEGEIGYLYAKANNYSEQISKGILEHYFPRFSGDNFPKTTSGFIVGLADKLDNITSLFAIGKIPSGSADPFALRRQAQGIIDNTLNKNISIDLNEILDHLINKVHNEKTKTSLPEEKRTQIKDFITQRLINSLESLHYEKDIIQSVISTGNPLENILAVKEKIDLLKEIITSNNSESFKSFLTAAKRLVRIVDGGTNGNVDIKNLHSEHEIQLYKKLEELHMNQSLAGKELLSKLTTLTEPINKFFDHVLVNDPDPKIKSTRQSLLKIGKKVFERICDFNKLQERT